jgi:hypothetical protein
MSVRADIRKAMDLESEEKGPIEPDAYRQSPHTKDDAGYKMGTKTEYCGVCEYYQVKKKDGCKLVQGYIQYDHWCRFFEKDDEPAPFVDA